MMQFRILDRGLPGIAEIIITSKVYSSYDECLTNLFELIGMFSAAENHINPTVERTLVQTINPLFATPGMPKNNEDWDSTSIFRVYLATTESIASKQLNYGIVGQINIDERPLRPDQATASSVVQ